MNFDSILSSMARDLRPSPIQEMLPLAGRKGMISFVGGGHDPLIVPVPEFAGGAVALGRNGMQILSGGPAEGYAPLRDFLKSWLAPRVGGEPKGGELLMTSGVQQTLDVFCAAVLDPGDAVIVEAPTYCGALHTMRCRGAHFAIAERDDFGMLPGAVAGAVEAAKRAGHRAKFIYLMPDFQNPTGAVMPADRRAKLLEAARSCGLMIFEDDSFGLVRFDGEPEPTIASIEGGEVRASVVHAGSFSSMLSSGIRVGWAVGPEPLIRKMTLIKQGADLASSQITQALVEQYCRDGYIEPQLRKMLNLYRKKRDAMAASFERHLPKSAEYIVPSGGFSFWVRLPGMDTNKIFMKGLEMGIAIVRGASFYANDGGTEHFRASFTVPQITEIDAGVQRLANAIKAAV